MQPNQVNQNQPQPNSPVQSPKSSDDPKADSSALWAMLSGIAVLLYHGGIAIIQPDEITIFWYITLLPIILGVGGIKSKKRLPMAIAGIVLGVISIIIVIILFTTVYKFTR